jgi:hypothetical protein
VVRWQPTTTSYTPKSVSMFIVVLIQDTEPAECAASHLITPNMCTALHADVAKFVQSVFAAVGPC